MTEEQSSIFSSIYDYFVLPFKKFISSFKTNGLKSFPFLELLLAMVIPMAQYAYGIGSVGMFIFYFVAVVYFLKSKQLSFFTPLIALCLYCLTIGICKLIITPNTINVINQLGSMVLFCLSLCAIVPSINMSKLSSAFIVVGLIFAVGLYYQAFLVYGLGQKVAPIKIFFTPTEPYEAGRFAELSTRPESVFLEPGTYAAYIIISLFFSLKNRRYFEAAIFELSILLSASTNGLIISFIIIFLFILIMINKSRHRQLYTICFIFIAIIAILLFLYLPIFEESKDKLFLVLQGNSSFIPRVVAVFDIVGNFSPFEFVFGTSYSSLDFFESSNTYLIPVTAYYTYGYVNTIGSSVFSYGFLALIFLLAYYIIAAINLKGENRVLLVQIVVSVIATSNFFNISFWFQCLLLLSLAVKDQKYFSPFLFINLPFYNSKNCTIFIKATI